MVLKLANVIDENNYVDIIIFLQKNKYDFNNALIDQIINEEDNSQKEILIAKMNNDISTDFNSSGYASQLFSLFKNNELFYIIKSKKIEYILCGKKFKENVKDNPPFKFIKKEDLDEKHIYNILIKRYKEIYSYDCECLKGSKEDVLCTKVKYNRKIYSKILFILFEMNFEDWKDIGIPYIVIYKFKEQY